MVSYEEVVCGIKPPDKQAAAKAWERLDSLVKPPKSLGRLEEIAAQAAGITGKVNNELKKKCIIIMSADNGICEEGVSSCPQEITRLQTVNFVKGLAGINVLARHAGAELRIVDVGIKGELNVPGIINKKTRPGTANMLKGPAMRREEAKKGIEAGMEIVGDLVTEGFQLLGTGEMGIGNTTTSSAVLMAFTGCDGDTAVGKGAGLTEEGLAHKKSVIKKVLEVNRPDAGDPLDVLAKVGGLDIAGLTGCFLAAAYHRVPIVIDGFISAAAALTAYKINPLAKEYMIASHASLEPGFARTIEEIGLAPMLNMNMRLGEGTGCALAFHLIDAAMAVMNEMATFEEASICDDFLIK